MNEHLEKWALIPSDPGNLITNIKTRLQLNTNQIHKKTSCIR